MKTLGVNIDHIATLRNVRRSEFPNLMRSVELIHKKCKGVEYITIHLREDRRHINDSDATTLCELSPINVNLEIACTEEMVNFALQNKPYSVCLVPEKREEMTTESGLNLMHNTNHIADSISRLKHAGIRTSLFLDPTPDQIHTAKAIGADIIEIHTGTFANKTGIFQQEELKLIDDASKLIVKLQMECHAGHGITYQNAPMLAKIPEISLFNIGHFLICEAVFMGLESSVNKMYDILNHNNQ